MNRLVEFWNECDLHAAPYIHPRDMIEVGNEPEFADKRIFDHRQFISSDRFAQKDDKSFHLSLLPVPYQGNLETADIFILLLNPGLGLHDYYTNDDTMHSECLRHIIRQKLNGVKSPFLSLDPQFSWSGGFLYWEKKLRKHLRAVADERFDGDYAKALGHLSQRFAAIEIVPYHSRIFGAGRLLRRLKSAQEAITYIRDVLVPRAKEGSITVIATRQIKSLSLPTDHENIVLYTGSLARGAQLGPETIGGQAIQRQLDRHFVG